MLRPAKLDLTCRICHAPCYWQEAIDKAGKPSPRLFSGGKPHRCNHADDFDDLTN